MARKIIRNGCEVSIFETETNGWAFTVGGCNVYFGFASRRAAFRGIRNAIG